MIKLIIKKVGYFLKIPGIHPVRTPAEVDISKVDINTVKSELKRQGITKYKIEGYDIKSEVKKIKSNKKQIEANNINIDDLKNSQDKILNGLKSQQQTIDSVVSLLNNFLENNNLKTTPIEKNIDDIKKINTSSKLIDKEDEFIPSINLGKVKGSSSSKKVNKGD